MFQAALLAVSLTLYAKVTITMYQKALQLTEERSRPGMLGGWEIQGGRVIPLFSIFRHRTQKIACVARAITQNNLCCDHCTSRLHVPHHTPLSF